MTERVFMASVDVTDPTFDVSELKKLIKNRELILGWWNHIPSLYLLRTRLDEDKLTDLLRGATHDARLLVMEVNPLHSQGWLPEKSWQWIKSRENDSGRAS